MQPMKTRTVQDVPKPAFSEWWCYIHGITPTSPLKAKLETMNTLKALGAEIPAFIKKNASEAPKTSGALSAKAITESPKVDRIVWEEDETRLSVTVHFKNGETTSVSEDISKLEDQTFKKFRERPSTDQNRHETMRVHLLRRLFRVKGFAEQL